MSKRFVESEHKRDERGRFAQMGTSELKKRQEREVVEHKNIYPEKAYGFAKDKNNRKGTKHHIAHAKEMGYNNQDDYEVAAVKFFNGNEGKLYYEPRRNRFYRYDEKTKRMCVSSNGIIHTFVLYTKKKFSVVIQQEGLHEL